jgi:nucleotide-binding universal stress UspA family protein
LTASPAAGAGLPASILCPVDFSDHAERALRHAVALAAATGGHLTVLAVNDPLLVAAAGAAGRGDTVRAQVEAELRAMLERLPLVTPRLLPALDIATGHAAEEILRAVGRTEAGLIVMGTQGLGGASKLVFGSTTERVIRESPVPVLAVPAYTPERFGVVDGTARLAPGHVVAAIGLDGFDDLVAAAAARWAAAGGAALLLAHVCVAAPTPGWWPISEMPLPPAVEESAEDARTRLEALAARLPQSAGVEVRRGSIPREMAAIVRDAEAGLLVVSRGGTAHRVGATAYRVMREADVPTLVVAG